MFISIEQVKDGWGVDVDIRNLRLAQMMIETYVGRTEQEVEDAHDQFLLARATAFQATYIKDNEDDILEQIAVKKITLAENTTEYDTSLLAPFMSPIAILACKRLSWFGTKTLHTGPIFDRTPAVLDWERS